MKMLNSLWKFVNYWYLRYLLITELYMVEKWERVMIHIVFSIIFMIISIFNWAVILNFVNMVYEPSKEGLIDSITDLGIITGCIVGYSLISNKM